MYMYSIVWRPQGPLSFPGREWSLGWTAHSLSGSITCFFWLLFFFGFWPLLTVRTVRSSVKTSPSSLFNYQRQLSFLFSPFQSYILVSKAEYQVFCILKFPGPYLVLVDPGYRGRPFNIPTYFHFLRSFSSLGFGPLGHYLPLTTGISPVDPSLTALCPRYHILSVDSFFLLLLLPTTQARNDHQRQIWDSNRTGKLKRK